jgi:uncharacterized protein (DUF697 family)
MLNMLKQARAALGMLNPEEVRKKVEKPIHVGLVAASDAGYSEMEDFLVPTTLGRDDRIGRLGQVHRAGDADVPAKVDLVLYQQGLDVPEGAYEFRRDDPASTIAAVLSKRPDETLALARQFPPLRKRVTDEIIMAVAKENALFSIATALPNIIPSMMSLPWALGEFASDTAFLTANQIRMAFQIAAACGSDVGFSNQKGAVVSIVASAFGWRALARELAGKIPLGEGLIPKAAIAFAGTYVVGKGLQRFASGGEFTRDESESVYREALNQGKDLAHSLQRRS